MTYEAKRLPKDPGARVEALLYQSMPDARSSLPALLPLEAAEAINEGRAARSVMYASSEDLNDRVRELGEDMREIGVVLHVVDEDDESSLVHHMADAERTCEEGERAAEQDSGQIPARVQR